jgi:hypothetical protein
MTINPLEKMTFEVVLSQWVGGEMPNIFAMVAPLSGKKTR